MFLGIFDVLGVVGFVGKLGIREWKDDFGF